MFYHTNARHSRKRIFALPALCKVDSAPRHNSGSSSSIYRQGNLSIAPASGLRKWLSPPALPTALAMSHLAFGTTRTVSQSFLRRRTQPLSAAFKLPDRVRLMPSDKRRLLDLTRALQALSYITSRSNILSGRLATTVLVSIVQ